MATRATSPNARRRELLGYGVASTALWLPFQAIAAPTPACGDDHHATPRQTAGPFYLPHSPQRTTLVEPGIDGTRLMLTGRVMSMRCQPVAGALLDFWQADAKGDYDVEGFRLRGHQATDAEGRYTLDTIVPGGYPGRTRHLHVSVQAPNAPVLVTQLYFPREPRNATDGLFDARLVMALDGARARFDFVIAV